MVSYTLEGEGPGVVYITASVIIRGSVTSVTIVVVLVLLVLLV